MGRRVLVIVVVAVAAWVGVVAWSYWNPPKGEGNMIDRASANLAQYLISMPEPIAGGKYPAVETFFLLASPDRNTRVTALQEIEAHWQPGCAVMLLEISRLQRGWLPQEAFQLLRKKTQQRFGRDIKQWYRYLWQQSWEPHPQYARFKAALYARIDPRFAEYFDDTPAATIRFDEIQWGGVVRDGIPPLKNPAMIAADQADFMVDSNVVFGIEINGDARAYPKRILAWHEMFKDTVGDVSINGVYCTLCGSMIVYETHVGGKHYELGTSGFLYRSNKLMYDHDTKSMWSTLTGEPVVGTLVGEGIQLSRRDVVTTTWGEWRRRHPATTVLSLSTGHRRNYGEGVAYHDYFATDRLMFDVPFEDQRLKNKQEVLALRFGHGVNDAASEESLAIDTNYLQQHPVYQGELGSQPFVVLTDKSGANRVYDPKTFRFATWNGDHQAMDERGTVWQVTESGLTDATGQVLARLPAHRAFWFGWHAAFPKTRLVQ